MKEANKINFSNTEIAFKNKSDQELKKAEELGSKTRWQLVGLGMRSERKKLVSLMSDIA